MMILQALCLLSEVYYDCLTRALMTLLKNMYLGEALERHAESAPGSLAVGFQYVMNFISFPTEMQFVTSTPFLPN